MPTGSSVVASEPGGLTPTINTHLPRLRGATCMTLGGTDKKGGPWDRLSWHHAATFQYNHRRSRLTQLLSFHSSSSSSSFTRTPYPFRPSSTSALPGPVLDRLPFLNASVSSLSRFISWFLRVRSLSRDADSVYSPKKKSLRIFLSIFLLFFNRLSLTPLSKCYSPRHTFTELSRFTGRSSEVRSLLLELPGMVGEARSTRGRESTRNATRVSRRTRSISTTGRRRHRESLL